MFVNGYRVLLEPDEGGFHIWAPSLKGCHSWGSSEEKARQHIHEAIELWIESAAEEGIPVPAAGSSK
jgi:predicted RNase H-like HicB family nuclease